MFMYICLSVCLTVLDELLLLYLYPQVYEKGLPIPLMISYSKNLLRRSYGLESLFLW